MISTRPRNLPIIAISAAALLFLLAPLCLFAQEAGEQTAPAAEKAGLREAPPEPQASPQEQKQPDIEEVLKGIRESIDTLQKNQADAGADMTALGDQIRKLRGDIEELGKSVESLRNDRKELEAKWSDVLSRIKVLEDVVGLKDARTAEVQKGTEEAKPSAEGEKEKPPDEKTAYAEAFADFRGARYDEARTKFQNFLEQYPESPLADAAQLWIGECYYLEKDYEKAILEYEKVIKNYPGGDKVPLALLKQGLAFYQLGDASSAKLLFQKIVDEYPHTNQARIAKKKLAAFREKP